MQLTQKLTASIGLTRTIVKIFLIIMAIILAFTLFIQFTPTIAHAQDANTPLRNPFTGELINSPLPRRPIDNSSNNTTNTRNTSTRTNGGKPINVCGVISTCPRWIDAYKTESNTPESLAKSVVKFILTFVYFAIYVSSAVAVAFIVVAGYRYITSQGDEKNTKLALDTLKNAVIGLALAILSLTIVTLIGNFLTNVNF